MSKLPETQNGKGDWKWLAAGIVMAVLGIVFLVVWFSNHSIPPLFDSIP